jgi:hypothetical protein
MAGPYALVANMYVLPKGVGCPYLVLPAAGISNQFFCKNACSLRDNTQQDRGSFSCVSNSKWQVVVHIMRVLSFFATSSVSGPLYLCLDLILF